jgi:hypothetical protein
MGVDWLAYYRYFTLFAAHSLTHEQHGDRSELGRGAGRVPFRAYDEVVLATRGHQLRCRTFLNITSLNDNYLLSWV